ncbi:hypothetical protein L6R49_14765 [Myxococcota bacterium]|nr:hypothetical protein [Myxococcota bacterium]
MSLSSRLVFFPSCAVLFALIANVATATEPTLARDEAPALVGGYAGMEDLRVKSGMPMGGMPSHGGAGSFKTTDASQAAAVKYLLSAQQQDGGWASGNWSAGPAQSDVATTALVTMALLRDGDKASLGAVKKGAHFISQAVLKSDANSPQVRTPQGTQPQAKLGQLADTHFAALALSELVGRLDADADREVRQALDVAVKKVELAQKGDGSFDGQGWAPVLSSSVAVRSLYNAQAAGVSVNEEVLDRAEDWQVSQVTADGRDAGGAAAGVDLYATAATMSNSQRAKERGGAAAPAAAKATEAIAQRVQSDSAGLVYGFGSIGGEEMLSYMMMSEAMAEEGGASFEQWKGQVGALLLQSQSADGSWSGHHCITSTPFTTAGAVLTLAVLRDAPSKGGKRPPAQSDRRGDIDRYEDFQEGTASTLTEG